MESFRSKIKKLPLGESIEIAYEIIGSDETIIFFQEYQDIERRHRLDIVTYDDYKRLTNQLKNRWLKQIDFLSDDEINRIASNLHLGISSETLQQKLNQASVILTTWPHTFQNTNGCHIPRKETNSLLQWIEASLPDEAKGLALLVGDAGSGKSVILRDIFHDLDERQIPVLGIKADRYCTESIADLEKRLNLSEGIESMIRALARSNDRVVVLVDQIDALSQSLSTRRAYLDTFIHLISLLADIPNIRIVISCRTYDLENDQALSFSRHQKKFVVGKLEATEVKTVIQHLSDKAIDLSPSLLELLKTPLHLDVFCRVYQPNFSTEKITILRDLYDELWRQKITDVLPTADHHISAQQCKMLMYKLAEDMYIQQRLEISVKSKYAEFTSELKYLQSTGLLHKNQNGLAFFHQTFYDYTFALQFVESKVSIEDYLKENEQCLHIRACLKMMIEFLRDRDQVEYIRLYRSILNCPDYYFHIKSLLISLLAAIKQPTRAEIQLAEEVIFPNAGFFKFFIQTLNSSEWLLLLLEQGLLECLYLPELANDSNSSEKRRYSNTMSMLNRVLVRHVPECRNEILEFTWNFPNIAPKAWLVRNVLHQLEAWDSPIAFQLFEFFYADHYDVFFSDLLKKAALYNLEWVLQQIEAALDKELAKKDDQFSELKFNRYLANLIKDLVASYPDSIFSLLLKIQVKDIQRHSRKSFSKQHSQIQSDFPWIFPSFDELHNDHTSLFSLLLLCVRTLARNQSTVFAKFVNENINSNSSTILLLLNEGFRTKIEVYAEHTFQFITLFLDKQGVDAHSTLTWRIRQLLKEVYSLFSDWQKAQIMYAVAEIESNAEKEKFGAAEDEDWIGQKRYFWLKGLPEKDIIQIPKLRFLFLDLGTRFNKINDYEPNRHGRLTRIGPPLNTDQYEKLSLAGWKDSFYKYNGQLKSGSNSTTGGMEQHARQFSKEVKKRPDFFYPLITELTQNKDLAIDCLIHGLEGLKDAEYDQEKILDLVKKIKVLEINDTDYVRRLISIFSYFTNAQNQDDYFFHLLIDLAKNYPDPVDESISVTIKEDKEESIFSSGFNTVRGHAAYSLLYCHYFKKHENLLFETLELIASKDLLIVRCQIIPRLALLTHLDRARTFKLFIALTQRNEAVIMERSSWSAKYLSWDNFEKMKPYFQDMFAYSKSHENTTTILALNWIYESNDSFDLLNQFSTQSAEAKKGVILTAVQNIRDEEGNLKPRSIELFAKYFAEQDEVVLHAYEMAFQYIHLDDFEDIKSTLYNFAQSNIAMNNPIPFYDYLSKCATKYPDDCLSLVKDYNRYEKPDINSGEYYSSAPLNVVLNAYHALWGKKKKDSAKVREALLLFDEMLQDDHLSNLAVGVLAKIVE